MKNLNVSKLSIGTLLVTTLLFGALLAFKIVNIGTFSDLSLIDITMIGSLALYAVIGVLTILRIRFVKALLIVAPLLSFALCTVSGGTFALALSLMLFASGIILMLCQFKKDGVPYWNVMMGDPTDTRTLTEKIGECFSANTSTSTEPKDRTMLLIGGVVVSLILASILALLIYAWGQVDFNIQWNMFKSVLMPIFYILGLFITIFNPVPKYTSWIVYKDEYGNEKKREKNNDIMEFMFTTFLLPLLMRFVVFPIFGAALLYYPIMCVLALVEAVIPILFLVIIALTIPIYIFASKNILVLKSKNSFLLFAPILTILSVGAISLIWLQTTDNKFSSYFTVIESKNSVSEGSDFVSVGDPSSLDSLSYALGANVAYSAKSQLSDISFDIDAMTKGVSDYAFGEATISSEKAVELLKKHMSGDRGKFSNESDRYQVSYAFGVDLATNILKSEIPIQTYWISQSIKDVYTGNAKMTASSATEYLEKYFTVTRPAELKIISERNLSDIEKGSGVKKSKSGLLYRIENAGDPNIKATSDSNIVKVHYTGSLLRNNKVFDSSHSSEAGTPVEFPLDKVIAGWAEGLKLVGKGGRISLWIPSELAYGTKGAGDNIGPNEALYFEVELLDVNP